MNSFKFELGKSFFTIDGDKIYRIDLDQVKVNVYKQYSEYSGFCYPTEIDQDDKELVAEHGFYGYDIDERDIFESIEHAEIELVSRYFKNLRHDWENSDIKIVYDKHFKDKIKFPYIDELILKYSEDADD